MNAPRTRTIVTVRCAVYCRKSVEDNVQEFSSIHAQREACEAFVKSQGGEGWICLADDYSDNGFTGANLNRPGLKRLLADIEAGKIDCIVCYKIDRLSRSLLDFSKLHEAFERNRVSFCAITQQINSASSAGRLMLNVLLSFAQFEREMISERTRDKIRAARRKGKWVGGMPILGYTVVESKLVVDAIEAEQVRQIFKLYLDSDGLLPVVEELARRGWRNKQWTTKSGAIHGGKAFNKNTLWNLLTNVAYVGKVGYKDEVHDGEHEAIVDQQLWDKVQAKLKENGRSGGSQLKNRYGFLLRGLLFCTACDCSMQPTHTKKGSRVYRYYLCGHAAKNGRKTCPTKSLPAAEIERFVVDQIKAIGRDPALVRETLRQLREKSDERVKELASEDRRLRRELARHHGELQTLAKRIAFEPATPKLADLQEAIAETERKLGEVTGELERLERERLSDDDVTTALAQFDPVWQALTPAEQAKLLRLLIERVEYGDGNLSITFHPNGLKSLGEAA